MVTKAEYEKAKAAVEKAYTADSIKSYTDAYNKARSSGSSASDAYSSASGLLQKNSTSGGGTSSGGSSSGGGTSSGGVSGNSTSGGDVYGDVSGKPTTTSAMDFSNYSGNKKLADADAVFGENAKIKEKNESGFLSRRNDSIASELYNLGTVGMDDVDKYLRKYQDFNNASAEEQANTIRAIHTRLSEIQKANGDMATKDTTTITGANGDKTTETTKTDMEETPSKDGYYFDKATGKYVKIYGYDDLDSDYRNLIDRMSEQDRKYLSNMWASGMQNQVKTYLDAMRSKEQAEARQKNAQDLYDINRAQSIIEAQQTLRHSQEQYDNLKQNWQYLGNMGMPGTSATKIQAIGDALKEAQTTLGEIQKLTKLKLDAQEKQWEGQVLQYNQQIDNLMYDLNWKVGSEVQAALSKFTTAELEGQLDTIDGITAFRKELLDDLDANISGLTSASLDQMKYITQQYQDVADKLYEYQQNANKVNPDMSTALGYYVDMNGNPIFNSKGETIQVPKDAPLNPIYDKDSGKLIVFGYDESGNIVANVQQIVNKGTSTWGAGGGYGNIFGTGAGTMRTERNNNPTAMTVDVAKSLGMVEGVDYERGDPFTTGSGTTLYTAKLIGDPIETTVKAFDNAAAKGIGIFYTQGGKQRWTHTAMTNEQWMALSPEEKKNVVLGMLQKEGGDINKMAYYNQGDNTQYPAALVRLFNKDKLTDSDYKWLEDEGISRWDFEEMRNDYLKQQGGDVAYGKGMGSSILDKIIVSEDNKASQNEDYGFASRAWRADEAIKELEKEFSWTWNWDTPEWTKSDKHKLFDSYKEAFINAWLRKESGANITDAEFIKAEKFFPKAGDSDEVIKQKQKLREGIIEGLFQSSGKASDGTELVEIYRNNKDKKIVGEEATTEDGGREGILDKMIETNINGEGKNTTFDETWVR